MASGKATTARNHRWGAQETDKDKDTAYLMYSQPLCYPAELETLLLPGLRTCAGKR
jgi:hypothetical protein